MTETQERRRIDKWLWFARMARTRSLAVALVAGGRIRLNGARVDAPGKSVKIGDVLTLNLPQGVRVARILGLPHRRGPAPEAAQCWLDLTGAAGPEDNKPGRGPDEDNADSTTLEM